MNLQYIGSGRSSETPSSRLIKTDALTAAFVVMYMLKSGSKEDVSSLTLPKILELAHYGILKLRIVVTANHCSLSTP